jgi:hypothetical protein
MTRGQTPRKRTSPGRPRKHPAESPPDRVAAYLPSELAERLRVYTVRLKPRRSLSDVISQAIRELLEREDLGIRRPKA